VKNQARHYLPLSVSNTYYLFIYLFIVYIDIYLYYLLWTKFYNIHLKINNIQCQFLHFYVLFLILYFNFMIQFCYVISIIKPCISFIYFTIKMHFILKFFVIYLYIIFFLQELPPQNQVRHFQPPSVSNTYYLFIVYIHLYLCITMNKI
jgi:hypothetical protein